MDTALTAEVSMNKSFEIPYYHDYISPALLVAILKEATEVEGVENLQQIGVAEGLETTAGLKFLCKLYEITKSELGKVLSSRIADRIFIDQRVASCYRYNQELKIDFLSPDYKTVIGLEDSEGRIVIGPKNKYFASQDPNKKSVAEIPSFLQGSHVTLFGPPDNAKLAVNAMNAYHRKLKEEPLIVDELLVTHQSIPKWGADDEDSKTPLRKDLQSAGVNLTNCFNRTIKVTENNTAVKKTYELAKDKLSLPIKRFPGLALPSFFLFYRNNPIPLHLYDFALHFFANWNNPEALCFYVPKLENEEEAKYIKFMLHSAEKILKELHPEYMIGTIRLLVVLENPRAILRTHEIMDELYPYFAGASLGWHDYLASTARLFKEDGNYRIPVKADPNIVIKYIKGSHDLLAEVVGSRGGIKVGGMYGILPITTELFSESFQVTIVGFFKDVITQLKRDLTGFWVAHPDFVRIGLAVFEAWSFHQKGDSHKLRKIVEGFLHVDYHQDMFDFIFGPDIEGLDVDDPMFIRSLLVADSKESAYISNNHPDEIRYNVFQSLQYLTDWLSGNGCVALPAQINGIAVRVMDDLATAERSRWEVWHEIYHGRFSLYDFLKIAHEEMHFIRKDLSDTKKIVQVKWDDRTAKWYPVAFNLMIRLMTDKKPVEFATELLLPFTLDSVRASVDPWKKVSELDPHKFFMTSTIERFNYYFEMCGCFEFAMSQTKNIVIDAEAIANEIDSFTKDQIIEAATFHGNIGESRKTLDAMATTEQLLVFKADVSVLEQLEMQGEAYLKKFGVKFLVSAYGKSASELLALLNSRINNSENEELKNAREALREITLKRINLQVAHPMNVFKEKILKSLSFHRIKSAQISISSPLIQQVTLGEAGAETWFEFASLSKTVASAFAIDYFHKNNISLDMKVNEFLKNTSSSFRLRTENEKNKINWPDEVTIRHLMNHSALNLHYVNGYPANGVMPDIASLLKDILVINNPGEKFQYSGAGFIVLEYLLEVHSGKKITDLTKSFAKGFAKDFSFDPATMKGIAYANGYDAKGNMVDGGRLMFPSFAAGAMGTADSMSVFLNHFTEAYSSIEGSGPISHDVACEMMLASDNGCQKFMGCEMGLGVFVAHAGENKLIIHQGANDGFRAIFIHCVRGPDKGMGLVIQCTGELNGVLFIAEVSQVILRELKIGGIDFNRIEGNFTTDYLKNIRDEEIVNIGYKKLIFDAFVPNLPEQIIDLGTLDPLAEINLAVGGKILDVSNQMFARAENLLSPFIPVFDPKLYGKQGKVMDSWETVRHNQKECDHLIFELKKPSIINFVSLSTKYHLGNQADYAEVEGFCLSDEAWYPILNKTKLQGHAYHSEKSQTTDKIFSMIRVSNYPDGGLSRIGLYCDLSNDLAKKHIKSFVYTDTIPCSFKPLSIPYQPTEEEIKKNWLRLKKSDEVNLASMAFGARVIKASNEHYGPAVQVISPFAPISMFDGLESSRSRKLNHNEEVIIALARTEVIYRVEMDFTFFVHNNPLFVSVDGLSAGEWIPLVNKTRVKAFAGNFKEFLIQSKLPVEQIRVVTYPDGGMNRLRVFGRL